MVGFGLGLLLKRGVLTSAWQHGSGIGTPHDPTLGLPIIARLSLLPRTKLRIRRKDIPLTLVVLKTTHRKRPLLSIFLNRNELYDPQVIMTNRWNEMGRRPVRVANVSGYQRTPLVSHGLGLMHMLTKLLEDPPMEMFRQATLGDVDFLTGDYLAEVNMANNAAAYLRGEHPGWEQSAWEGLRQTIDVIGAKTMKVAINGGALNPRGLAEKVASLVSSIPSFCPRVSSSINSKKRREVKVLISRSHSSQVMICIMS